MDGKSSSPNFLHLKLYPISLKFEDVGYHVKMKTETNWFHGGDNNSKEKQILTGISGEVFPGEILAMIGPSGSGKTTLLTALGGRLPKKVSGSILYNNRAYSGTFKRRLGFVTQEDVLYPHLTVFETLLYTALLRLPDTLTRAEKEAHADRVVSELALTGVRNSIVGGGSVKGVSGGERKRVSIGQEMVINPSLLLLDEPTSGLDSTTALRIMTELKGLASGGRTVLTTIHQPSSRIFHMFDKLLLLSEGRPLYYGAASGALDYFGSVGFPAPVNVNPSDHLLDLANGIRPGPNAASNQEEADDILVKKTLFEAYEKNISMDFHAEIGNSISQEDDIVSVRGMVGEDDWCSCWWQQVKVVMERGVMERRFDAFNILRIFQVISVAFLAGLLWWQTPSSSIQDRVSLISFFTVFWGFYPLYNAVFIFPQERRILVKERSSGMYHLTSYFVARTLGDLPFELVLPSAFVFILYWMGGLKPIPIPFILSLLVILYTVLVAQSLGLAIGAVMITDVKKATTLASVVTLVFLIAGGYYVQHIPPFIVWLKYLSFSYYCFKLLLEVQYSDSSEEYKCGELGLCRVWDHPSIRSVGLGRVWVDVSAMACMLVGYRVLAYLALRRQLRTRK